MDTNTKTLIDKVLFFYKNVKEALSHTLLNLIVISKNIFLHYMVEFN